MRVNLAVPVGFSHVRAIWLDTDVDRLEIEHDGQVTWDELQSLKTLVWGEGAVAVEVYPPSAEVINTGNFRHLWRWLKSPLDLPSMIDDGARQ
jgi:hypothetical protein